MKRIVFILGKPGSGKGTICSYLSSQLPVQHFSAGELLREEVRNPNSKNAQLILDDMKAGRIVKPEITVALLEAAMNKSDAQAFLIDGFPREIEQFEFFKNVIDESRCYLMHLDCTDEECIRRIKGRQQGRVDDNDETLNARLKNFRDETLRVIAMFEAIGRTYTVDAAKSKEEVCAEAKKQLNIVLALK